ncbi:dicarboxylate/amino acid:cation symporter [Lentibacillus jeotgali]|uniref:dicarboxylate/amino acid:cation symporter n=1 Tax=Lentibacillus jeotgali TaxID=558169 RepID=UPI0002628813|nr:dicarboxylate/amino acid:cation symporter [Lentibacillus jeotgali]
MRRLWRGYIEASLMLKITIALALGVLAGLIFGEDIAILSPFGDLLLRLLQFLIVPLILFTLIVGVNQTKLGDLGRMGGKVFIYYIVSSAFAITVGIAVASMFNPGTGMTLDTNEEFEVPEDPGTISVLLSIVPKNIITAFSEPNLLGIIFTALAFGIAISALRSSEANKKLGETVYNLVDGLNEATLTIMKAVIQYVPIGIFAIIAEVVGNQGADTLAELGSMVGVLYVALIVQLLFYVLIMAVFKVNIKDFFRHGRTPMITAFVTQSSSGTLPLTLNAASELNLRKSLYGFSLPLGATANMDGAAIRIAVSAVFAANVVGDPLSFAEILQVVLIGTLASVGTAGVPGAGIIMIATVFAQLGLPMEAVGLLTAIDVLVGMGCTALNVTGDLAGTSIINKTEKSQETERAS